MKLVRETLKQEELISMIEKLAKAIYQDIKHHNNPTFSVPSRSSDNIIYNERKDVIYLGDRESKRSFHNTGTSTAFTQMLFILSIIHEAAVNGKHLTKREIYYQDPELFDKDQKTSDDIIEDIAVTLGVTRPCLRVVATAKGVCIGDLTLREGEDTFNCNMLG